jgi:hypothetical protein
LICTLGLAILVSPFFNLLNPTKMEHLVCKKSTSMAESFIGEVSDRLLSEFSLQEQNEILLGVRSRIVTYRQESIKEKEAQLEALSKSLSAL